MVKKNGHNGHVGTPKYTTPDGAVIFVGPWKMPPTASSSSTAPSASAPAYAAAPVETYGAPPSTPTPSLSRRAGALEYVPEESEPSHFERAAGELEQAVEILTPIHRGLSSIATIGTYTAAGLVAGVGFGTLAYNLMDNPRSVSASLLVGGICTLAGVVAGWYKAHHNEQWRPT